MHCPAVEWVVRDSQTYDFFKKIGKETCIPAIL